MKFLQLIFLIFFCAIFAQNLPLDIDAKDSKDIFLDDYGNIYLYKNHDLSFTKYDSLGNQTAKLLFTLPQKIQSIHNPLNIVSFSENTQELKLFDQNFAEIQTLKFQEKFSHIKATYTEDLQYIWLLDDSEKKLIQYNYREDKVISSYPIYFKSDDLDDFLVYNKKIYLLQENNFRVFDFNSNLIAFEENISANKLSIENEKIQITGINTFSEYTEKQGFKSLFTITNATFVDKNKSHYLALIEDKLYLYKIK